MASYFVSFGLPWLIRYEAGIGPQSLRGLPNGFSSQQQLPQPRSASSRLPNGKMGAIASVKLSRLFECLED
jgi:hypothetical protein